MKEKALVLFDGECNLCNSSVQFIIKRDRQAYFTFASMQSEAGASRMARYGLPQNINSFVLIEYDTAFTKSDAALRICRQLSGAWKLLLVFSMIPKPIRDYLYSIIAKNRYKWFGKRDSCMIPTPEIRSRFLD